MSNFCSLYEVKFEFKLIIYLKTLLKINKKSLKRIYSVVYMDSGVQLFSVQRLTVFRIGNVVTSTLHPSDLILNQFEMIMRCQYTISCEQKKHFRQNILNAKLHLPGKRRCLFVWACLRVSASCRAIG